MKKCKNILSFESIHITLQFVVGNTECLHYRCCGASIQLGWKNLLFTFHRAKMSSGCVNFSFFTFFLLMSNEMKNSNSLFKCDWSWRLKPRLPTEVREFNRLNLFDSKILFFIDTSIVTSFHFSHASNKWTTWHSAALWGTLTTVGGWVEDFWRFSF